MSDNYKAFEEIIGLELQRSRHKPNKFFGYFHQDIVQYLKGCEVPKMVRIRRLESWECCCGICLPSLGLKRIYIFLGLESSCLCGSGIVLCEIP